MAPSTRRVELSWPWSRSYYLMTYISFVVCLGDIMGSSTLKLCHYCKHSQSGLQQRGGVKAFSHSSMWIKWKKAQSDLEEEADRCHQSLPSVSLRGFLTNQPHYGCSSISNLIDQVGAIIGHLPSICKTLDLISITGNEIPGCKCVTWMSHQSSFYELHALSVSLHSVKPRKRGGKSFFLTCPFFLQLF